MMGVEPTGEWVLGEEVDCVENGKLTDTATSQGVVPPPPFGLLLAYTASRRALAAHGARRQRTEAQDLEGGLRRLLPGVKDR